MDDDRTRRARGPGKPTDPVSLPAEETRIEEVRAAPPPPGSDVDVDIVHAEERARVLADGTVVREGYRVEQRSRGRELLPWILIALLLALGIGGFAVWYFTRASTKPVPAVVGLRIDDAVTRLQDDGFKTQIARQSNAKQPGVVFGQNPAADSKADSGSTVRLLVSSGPSSSTVLNAVGLPQSEARGKLVDAGFAVTTAQVFSDQPTGTVVAQDPAAGARVAPGTKVRLNVSKGSGDSDVPSEVGNTLDQAESELAAQGFKPSVTRVPSDQPLDTVVAQSPSAGKARKGSTVRLSVSEGPQAATTQETTTTTTTVPATTETTSP
jgi:beta-lactam-binding protein with PASTA domain